MLQHNAYVSVASDLAGSCTPNAGSLKFDLSKTDGLDIVGACIAQVEKIKKQQEIPKPTPASATHQASTSSSTAEPIQEAQPATPLSIPQHATQTESAPIDSIETVLMLAPATPLSENEAFDFVQTALNQHGQTIDNEHARKLLTMGAPAVTKGTAIGFLKLVNPANLLLNPYYKVQLASELTGFVFKEVVYFASYLQLRSTDPIAAQQVLDKCTEPFKKLGTTWDALDEPARVEMISQLAIEIIASNKVTQIRDQFMKSAIEKTAKFAATSKVLKGLTGTEHAPATSQAGAQKLVDDKIIHRVNWTNHGFKHCPPRNKAWKDVISSTKDGAAKYHPNIDIEKIERLAWEKGKMCTNRKTWKVMKFDQTVGAKNGIETTCIRVECSANTIHGHPITLDEYMKLTS